MKERPILFSAPMVAAILAGQKTQTRRIVKPQPVGIPWFWEGDEVDPRPQWFDAYESLEREPCGAAAREISNPMVCPYGVPGDRLWSRETWRPWSWREDNPIGIEFRADGSRIVDRGAEFDSPNYEQWHERIGISATEECERALKIGAPGLRCDADVYTWAQGGSPLKWRPSIHMARWASRITLENTGVRVERLNDISEADAVAEGADTPGVANIIGAAWSARDCFAKLWEHIHGKGSWVQSKDVWVWVIEFRRVEGGSK